MVPRFIAPLPGLIRSVRSDNLGIVIILFVQCMAVLLSPNSRARGDIKWRLVVFAAVMFSLATIGAALGFTFRSVIFINGREFPGAQGGEIPPGPLGYSDILFPQAINIVCEITFQFNQWLADGFLVRSLSKSVTRVGYRSFL